MLTISGVNYLFMDIIDGGIACKRSLDAHWRGDLLIGVAPLRNSDPQAV